MGRGRVSTGDARKAVTFRLSHSQLETLDQYSEWYHQGRGELMREAVQMWIAKQIEIRGLPPVKVGS